MKAEHQPIRKPHYRWLLISLAVGFFWTSLMVFEVVMFNVSIRGLPTPFRVAAIVIPLVLLVGVCLILLMGTRIVPWRYSVFGPYERSPPPKGFRPQICISFEHLGRHYVTRYEVGKEGIELTFVFRFRAFIPAASITAVGPAGWGTYILEHDSPEIGSPIIVSQEVGQALLVGLGRTEPPK